MLTYRSVLGVSFSVFASTALAGPLLGCSSDAGTAANPPPPPAPAPAATPSLSIFVYGATPGGRAPTPIPGATVALDPAGGGERIERVTDADGRAVIEADFTKGPATVTAFADERVAVTMYGVTPDTAASFVPLLQKGPSDLVVMLPLSKRAMDARTVRVSGTIKNKSSTSNRVNITPTAFGLAYDDTRDRYEVRVAKGVPFTLLGSEYAMTQPDQRSLQATIAKFFTIDRSALEADETFDIDVAAAPEVAIETRRVHLTLPGGGTGPFGGESRGGAYVVDPRASAFVGVLKKSAPSADANGFDCDVAIANLHGALPAPAITDGVLWNPDGSTSVRTEPGVLPDGSTLSDFMPAPAMPEQTTVGDGIPLDGVPAEAEHVEVTLASSTGGVVWAGRLHRTNASTPFPAKIAIPALPAGASIPASTTGGVTVFAEPTMIGENLLITKKRSSSRRFVVKR